MTLSEFKAWFEGYTEGLEGAPTAAQFARIKEKVAQISGVAVTERIYVDKYMSPWRPYWDRFWWSSSSNGDFAAPNDITLTYASNSSLADKGSAVTAPFDSIRAMYELGKMEATH